MGRERIIEPVGRGLKSAREFVRTKPYALVESVKGGLKSTSEFAKTESRTILLGTGEALSVSGIVLAAVDVNETMVIFNTVAFTINAGVGIALKFKNSKSVHQQSHSPSTPEN